MDGVTEQVSDAAGDSVSRETREAVEDAVIGDSVGRETREAVEDAVGDSVGRETKEAVEDAVGDTTGEILDDFDEYEQFYEDLFEQQRETCREYEDFLDDLRELQREGMGEGLDIPLPDSSMTPGMKDAVGDAVAEGGGDTSFTWKLRGEDVTLNDVKIQEISYVKRSSSELKTLRNEFNTSTRREFLENLGKNAEYLRNAGFSETDILKIQNRRVPDGWQVHHILPLDDSGTNSFDNLVLIQNEPYHKVITNYQNSVARQMKIGEVQVVQWPRPNGNIYPAQH